MGEEQVFPPNSIKIEIDLLIDNPTKPKSTDEPIIIQDIPEHVRAHRVTSNKSV